MEDIDRIEVIRGPGASLWGANAVNGVINIITKSSRKTQGTKIITGIGTEKRAIGSMRYGGKWNENVSFRVYSMYSKDDDLVNSDGNESTDEWDTIRGGLRIDWTPTAEDTVMIQGEMYDIEAGETFEIVTENSLQTLSSEIIDSKKDTEGGYILGNWNHRFSSFADIKLQMYYDRFVRRSETVNFDVDTVDVDFQNRISLFENHEVIWGLGYRFIHDRFENTFTTAFLPEKRNLQLFSSFFQDSISFFDDQIQFTIGSKFEHSDFSGFEVQPNARVSFTPDDKQTIWVAISRAIRTPSRAEDNVQVTQNIFPGTQPIITKLIGKSEIDSEEVIAYEIGYRIQPIKRLFFDIASFYSEYDNLVTFELMQSNLLAKSSPLPHLVIPILGGNKMDGETYGVELDSNLIIANWWKIRVAYSYLRMQLHVDEDSMDTTSETSEKNNPQQQFVFRSSFNFLKSWELDIGIRFVDSLPAQNIQQYLLMDVRLGWKPVENIEISLVGQNLFDGQHPEFSPEVLNTVPTETESGIYGKVTWSF